MSDEMTADRRAAYLEQVEPFRSELVLFAYRMLASVVGLS